MSDVTLRVDWCSYEAAKYAVEHWHYSKRLPVFKTVKTGAWEGGRFIGTVIFSLGISKDFGKPYGIDMWDVCELARVALDKHESPTSQIVSRAVKLLKGQSPGLRLIISFADPSEGHNGAIYQAMNWIYTGHQKNDKRTTRSYFKDGRRYAWREVSTQLMKHKHIPKTVEGAIALGFTPTEAAPKHKYLYPLDRAMRRQIAPLSQPYPKRADVGEMESRAVTNG